MTRVLIIEAAGLMWGSERSLLNMLAATPPGSVAVCCPKGAPLAKELSRLGVQTLTGLPRTLHQGSRWRRIVAAGIILLACRRFKPDVLYLNQVGLLRIAELATRVWRVPIVAHFRLFEEVDYLARRTRIRSRLKCLVASSLAVEKQVRSKIPLLSITLRQLYDPYILTSERVGMERPLRVVCAGRIEPAKGQDLLIDALATFGSADAPIECLFAGEGEPSYVELLRVKAARLKHVNFQWLGFVSDVPTLLRSAQVLAFPSERETLGRVILEAWDSGAVPVVFQGSGGAAEIVRSAAAGVIYETQSPIELARALQTALAMTLEDRSALALKGRSWIAANCQPGAFATAMQGIFASAASNPLSEAGGMQLRDLSATHKVETAPHPRPSDPDVASVTCIQNETP